MAPSADAVGSIQARLLKVLMVSLVGVMILCACVTWLVAYKVANDAYDHDLLDPAMDIVQNVRQGPHGPTLTLSPLEQEALLFDGSDRVFFQVRGPAGKWYGDGTRDLPPPPPERLVAGVPVFYSATVGDTAIRICALLSHAGFEVYVAETTNKRDRLVWEIILAALVPSLLVVVAAVGLVWFGVSHGLAPLRKLRNELQQRSPNDLYAVDESHAPSEVRPAIVALNRLFQRIRETSESQRRFLADAAHQLRTPLAGLQMQLELALRETNSESLRATLGKMRDAVLRTGKVTNRLLALARAEQASLDPQHFANVDLHALAERVGAQWIPRAIARNIDLGFDLAPATVHGDEGLLAEMLDNLVDNALRYTPAGGAVTVRCGLAAGDPYFGVEDNGIGIPAAEREKVLERFYRGAGIGGDGAGLGLAIVKEGADRHGAAVAISRPANGIGTFVCVRFEESVAEDILAVPDVSDHRREDAPA
ncbi:MAG: sensor histidine kinase [Pseudomonadota bacterium]|nr:sensor histidine kinase [Pseudomonadota bacterium]